MAKKRREKDEEEDIDFKIPKFDEQKFIQKEKRNARTLFFSFLMGLFIGLISFGFWVLLTESSSWIAWPLVLLFGVMNAFWLRYVFHKFNIDFKEFGRKEWISAYAIYFFSWLLVLVIMVNPPFYDGENPRIELTFLPTVQELGGTVLVVAQIADNVAVEKEDITFSLTDPEGNTTQPSFTYENTILQYLFTNPKNLTGIFTVTLTATDVNGRKNNDFSNVTFEYNTDALDINAPKYVGLDSDDDIEIQAREDLAYMNFLVYYTLDNGDPIYPDRDNANDRTEYQTSPQFEGWEQETNHTMHVYAEVMYYFIGDPVKYSNIVMDSDTYNFSTVADVDIGDDPSPLVYNCTAALLGQEQPENTINYPLPCPIQIQTPGFELILFLAALVITAIMLKRRRNGRQQP